MSVGCAYYTCSQPHVAAPFFHFKSAALASHIPDPGSLSLNPSIISVLPRVGSAGVPCHAISQMSPTRVLSHPSAVNLQCLHSPVYAVIPQDISSLGSAQSSALLNAARVPGEAFWHPAAVLPRQLGSKAISLSAYGRPDLVPSSVLDLSLKKEKSPLREESGEDAQSCGKPLVYSRICDSSPQQPACDKTEALMYSKYPAFSRSAGWPQVSAGTRRSVKSCDNSDVAYVCVKEEPFEYGHELTQKDTEPRRIKKLKTFNSLSMAVHEDQKPSFTTDNDYLGLYHSERVYPLLHTQLQAEAAPDEYLAVASSSGLCNAEAESGCEASTQSGDSGSGDQAGRQKGTFKKDLMKRYCK